MERESAAELISIQNARVFCLLGKIENYGQPWTFVAQIIANAFQERSSAYTDNSRYAALCKLAWTLEAVLDNAGNPASQPPKHFRATAAGC